MEKKGKHIHFHSLMPQKHHTRKTITRHFTRMTEPCSEKIPVQANSIRNYGPQSSIYAVLLFLINKKLGMERNFLPTQFNETMFWRNPSRQLPSCSPRQATGHSHRVNYHRTRHQSGTTFISNHGRYCTP